MPFSGIPGFPQLFAVKENIKVFIVLILIKTFFLKRDISRATIIPWYEVCETTTTTTTLFISPHNIQEIQNFITAVQTMIGALAARNNLRVKNARQPVKRKDV